MSSGDGCSSTCQIEPYFTCDWSGEPCEPASCGDGEQQWYMLEDGTYRWDACDDGNTASGDGCSATCAIEPGWACPLPGTLCHQPTCGDGFIDFIEGEIPGGTAGATSGGSGGFFTGGAGMPTTGGGGATTGGVFGGGGGGSGGSTAGAGGYGPVGYYEQCDDGNRTAGDGCSADCIQEPGWSCYGGSSCHLVVCGDGIADWPEQCDDGNSTPNDGCTACAYDGGGFGGTGGGSSGGGFPSAGSAGAFVGGGAGGWFSGGGAGGSSSAP